MTIVKDEVSAGWRAFNAPLEGVVSWLYLDVKGFVTTAIGVLVDPLPLALALPWRVGDRLAAAAEVEAEWRRVKAMRWGLIASAYRGALWLDDEAIDAVVAERLALTATALARHFPELADYPAPAQQALLSMAWALGAAFPPKWPRLSAAVERGDWLVAAEECAISTRGNAGVAARNAANRGLFLEAAVMGA